VEFKPFSLILFIYNLSYKNPKKCCQSNNPSISRRFFVLFKSIRVLKEWRRIGIVSFSSGDGLRGREPGRDRLTHLSSYDGNLISCTGLLQNCVCDETCSWGWRNGVLDFSPGYPGRPEQEVGCVSPGQGKHCHCVCPTNIPLFVATLVKSMDGNNLTEWSELTSIQCIYDKLPFQLLSEPCALIILL
jgi:hypothetical protein